MRSLIARITEGTGKAFNREERKEKPQRKNDEETPTSGAESLFRGSRSESQDLSPIAKLACGLRFRCRE
jgi:hypothetical protein